MLADAKVQEETASKAYEQQMHEMDVDKAMKDADIKSLPPPRHLYLHVSTTFYNPGAK